MTICIAGKNRIATEALQFLIKKYPDHSVVACKNKTDDGINTWQPSLQKFCFQNQIPLVLLKDLYDKNDLLFISLEYDKIINPGIFHTKKLYNIHFSKLPAYKGMYTSVMPLLNGETESGVTLHCIDKGIDTGDIIDQISFPLSLQTTAKDLYELYIEHGISIFKKNINSLIENDFKKTEQLPVGSSYYSKSTLSFSNIEINLNKTAFEIHNQLRAFTFREYQLPYVYERPIYRSEILINVSSGKPGTIHFKNDSWFVLNTIDYQIKLYIDN